ncbi:TIGR03758 family integrating conjugative element protein [Billgrantia desiderata]|mgnify:CR=1 FL=1|uniref:TIGR03758 family integrating conjugative element protein n=1 Tax=Billgrantia desiderata TaxID=52021 RepID=UPI00089F5A4C|nr:TIGR03758 family integrating conjugative element protein [Halomonas desiderata]MCE8013915.1 TIGR03758 family integrating conjugative element protein [Halomonas desiderata]SEG30306.1 integrating conjugative element protein, PFL_4701 family [Halomonas desiderata]
MDAFDAAAGSGVSAAGIAWLIGGFGFGIVLVWTGWVLLSAYRGWASENRGVDDNVFLNTVIHTLLITILMSWILGYR